MPAVFDGASAGTWLFNRSTVFTRSALLKPAGVFSRPSVASTTKYSRHSESTSTSRAALRYEYAFCSEPLSGVKSAMTGSGVAQVGGLPALQVSPELHSLPFGQGRKKPPGW